MGIYKSMEGKSKILAYYDKALSKLDVNYKNLFVDTRFGKTHVLEIGPVEGKPLVIFHGGNVTNPVSLSWFKPLMNDYHIYAPDTIGHPGKSDETRLSPRDNSYAQWAVDFLDEIGLDQAYFIGPSYGGGITIKIAAYAPERISKAVLLIPSGITSGSTKRMIFEVLIPTLIYKYFPNHDRLIQAVQPMLSEEINEELLEHIGDVLRYVKLESEFPRLVTAEELKGFKAPTLVLAGEKDIFFPSEVIIPRAKEIIPNLIAAESLKGSNHFPPKQTINYINKRIKTFLDGTM
jgi:pimeloyl-ACP methyl ester carboxylesterase